MVFEQVLGKIGERIDETINGINKKIHKTSKEVKVKVNESRENISDEFIKKMNKLGEKISPDSKDLSNLERAAANVGIGIARSIERAYSEIKKRLFIDPKKRKTKYGLLGKVWCENNVPKERGYACLNYAAIAERKIPSQNKLRKEVLKDIVESLSSSPVELYSFYVYGHLKGCKPSENHEKKKEIVNKYLMQKGVKNVRNEKKPRKSRKNNR